MAKTCEIRISTSTDSRTAHIGPYFVDVRDTTNGRNIQKTTRVVTAKTGAEFINALCAAAKPHDVEVTVVDNTYKKSFTGRGGLIGTAFSD